MHVLGAMVFVGLLAAVAVILVPRCAGDDRAAALRLAFRTLLIGAIPSYIVMRGAAEWVASEENVDEDAAWIGIGYIVTDVGLLLLIVVTVLDRARQAPGEARHEEPGGLIRPGHGDHAVAHRRLRGRPLGDDGQTRLRDLPRAGGCTRNELRAGLSDPALETRRDADGRGVTNAREVPARALVELSGERLSEAVGGASLKVTEEERRIEWEADGARGAAVLEPAGWGTKLTLTAHVEEEVAGARARRGADGPLGAPARRPRRPRSPAAPEPDAKVRREELEETLAQLLDDLGSAHRRPFQNG